MNLKLLIVIPVIFFISFTTLAAAENTTVKHSPAAIIKAFNGSDILIKYNKEIIPCKNYLNLYNETEITLSNNSMITIILKNGEKITLNDAVSIILKENVLSPLNPQSEKYLVSINKTMIYSKRDTLASRDLASKEEILTDEMTKEIKAIEENITDPALQALAKGDYYKSVKFTKHAAEEYKKHYKLTQVQ